MTFLYKIKGVPVNIKKRIKRIISRYEEYQTYLFYSEQFKSYLAKHGIANVKADGEEQYLENWKRLSNRIEPYSYRLFSQPCYMGKNKYIVPEDIGDTVIEYYLNPVEYRPFYSDKNMFRKYLVPKDSLPVDLLRRMAGGLFLDEHYSVSNINKDSTKQEIAKEFGDCDGVVIKPSDSCSGSGVMKFNRVLSDDGTEAFVDGKGCVLDGAFLARFNYGRSFVLQKAIVQHPYLSQFCSSSVNTMRLCVYRSVVDESVEIFAGALRIGHQGSVVDNLHAGGGFVKIDVNTGELGHVVYNQYGEMTKTLNGVNFDNYYQIPFWDEIRQFAVSIAKQIRHMRLLALDVSLDESNKPRLIEFNVKEFAFWIPMFSGQQVFGDKMEEVIEYCRKRLIQDKRI